jgi:hypothetical protein
VTGLPPLTVAVHIVLDPAATDPESPESPESQVTWACVAAGFSVVGLKFAVIVPKSFTVAVVLADEGSVIVMADALLTLQPEKA